MGWSKLGEGDDVIGDAPADMIDYVLSHYLSTEREKPTLEEMLNGIQMVLQNKSKDYLDDEKKINCIRYIKGSHESDINRSRDFPVLLAALDEAINNIVVEYEQMLDRKPRINEILGTFAFVLSGDPEKYLRGAESISIQIGDIVAE